MPSKIKKTNVINGSEFHITHADFVSMMNDEDVFEKNIVVPSNQIFELYIVNENGKEIFLKDISINKTLSIEIEKSSKLFIWMAI